MWFYETLYPDIKMGIQGRLIYQKRSPYQQLKIYATPRLGRVLSLDGTVQTTEKDEFIYHEMLTHPVLLECAAAQKVLVIGAGDGGVIREVLKHQVKRVVLVEIDAEVIRASKKFLPALSNGAFTRDKRLQIIIDDGARFIRRTKEKFDAVMVDSPDPIGVVKVLFSKKFYRDIFTILNSRGMMIRQTGSTMFQPQELRQNYQTAKSVFPCVSVQLAAVPTYVGGLFSFIIAAKKAAAFDIPYAQILRRYNQLKLNTKYYNPQIHFAARTLPNYIRRLIG